MNSPSKSKSYRKKAKWTEYDKPYILEENSVGEHFQKNRIRPSTPLYSAKEIPTFYQVVL